MRYLLDANVLIDANRDYYPLDRVPEFWEWLLHQAMQGRVKVPRESHTEVTDGKDALAAWAKEHREVLLEVTVLGPEPVRRALSEGYAPDLNATELEKLKADPFLAAYGLELLGEVAIVTTEVSKPKRKRANRQLPDGARGMIDALHHAAHATRTRSLEDARELAQAQRDRPGPAPAGGVRGAARGAAGLVRGVGRRTEGRCSGRRQRLRGAGQPAALRLRRPGRRTGAAWALATAGSRRRRKDERKRPRTVSRPDAPHGYTLAMPDLETPHDVSASAKAPETGEAGVVSPDDVVENFHEVRRRVEDDGERIAIRSNGRTIAGLVSAADLKLLEELEDRLDERDAREALADYRTNGGTSFEEVMAELGL